MEMIPMTAGTMKMTRQSSSSLFPSKSLGSGRKAPIRKQGVSGRQTPALWNIANFEASLSGIFSVSILLKITLMMPAEMPPTNRPKVKNGVVPAMQMAEPRIARTWAMRLALFRPRFIKEPPMTHPATRPITPDDEMIVLYRVVSSSVHANLASKTAVVYPAPARAHATCHSPRPCANVYQM